MGAPSRRSIRMNNNFAERGRQGESLLSSLARTGDVLARADRQYTSGPITCTPSLARRRLTHVHTCVRRRRGRGDAPAPPLTAQRTAPARHPHPDTNRRRAGTGLEERYWRGIRRAIAQPGGRNEWHTRGKGRTHLFEGLGPLLRRHLLDGDRLVGRPAGRLRVGAARVARRGRARAGKDAARWEDASEHRRRVASLRRPPKRRVVKLTFNVTIIGGAVRTGRPVEFALDLVPRSAQRERRAGPTGRGEGRPARGHVCAQVCGARMARARAREPGVAPRLAPAPRGPIARGGRCASPAPLRAKPASGWAAAWSVRRGVASRWAQ